MVGFAARVHVFNVCYGNRQIEFRRPLAAKQLGGARAECPRLLLRTRRGQDGVQRTELTSGQRRAVRLVPVSRGGRFTGTLGGSTRGKAGDGVEHEGEQKAKSE